MVARQHLIDVRVAAVRYEAEDVLSFELTRSDGADLPEWSPGAHIDVHVPSGVVRQYSLCSDPTNLGFYRIGVLHVRDGRGGSAAMHSVQAGTHLVISEPRNTFPLVDAPSVMLIAGGIGITPILSMARELAANGRAAQVLYAGRTAGRMAFLQEIRTLNLPLLLVPEDVDGRPDLDSFLASAAEGSAVMACGPTAMLDAVAGACSRTVPSHGLHVERFSLTPAPLQPSSGTMAQEFDVLLARTGTTVGVRTGESILAAVRAAGVDVPSSCEQGICGTCETKVLGGVIEHHDMLLSAAERDRGDTMMICVSRCAADKLTLDL